MAKRVFFSFHYQDVIDFRANVVRNHGSFKLTKSEAGFYDSSIWEEAKKESDLSLKRLINKGINHTSNTCVLVGTNTFERRWVDYEIMKSLEAGNHIFAVHINGIKCKNGKTKLNGNNPLYYLGYSFPETGKKIQLHNYLNGKWTKYTDLEGWTASKVLETDRNKIFRLSTIYPIYDWSKDDGYTNFKDWVR